LLSSAGKEFVGVAEEGTESRREETAIAKKVQPEEKFGWRGYREEGRPVGGPGREVFKRENIQSSDYESREINGREGNSILSGGLELLQPKETPPLTMVLSKGKTNRGEKKKL